MADGFAPDVHHAALEQDIQRLSAEVMKHREAPESRGASHQELLKKSIQSYTGNANSAVPVTKTDDAKTGGVLPNYAGSAPPEVKLEIEFLLDMAFHHGILKADKEARSSGPFVLDAFHDALVGKLYPELKKRGILG